MAFKGLCLVLCLTLYAIEANGFKQYVAYKRAQVTFFQAWQQCRLLGGHLASIESAAEKARADAAVLAVGDFKKDYLIGATDLGSEGNFVWIDLQKPTSYTYFYPGQPDNNQGVEHCVVLGAGQSPYWNDIACDYKSSGFICAFVRQ